MAEKNRSTFSRFRFANLFAFAFVISASSTSLALLELRGAVSLLNANPSELHGFMSESFSTSPKLSRLQGVSFDAIATFQTMPVGVGARLETFKGNDSGVGTETEIDWKRVSILLNKRFVDRSVYLGPIITVGISNDLKFRTGSVGSTQEFRAKDPFSASIGVEAGLSLFFLKLGGEVGYLHAPLGNLKNAETLVEPTLASGEKVKTDMSGTYARATVGLSF